MSKIPPIIQRPATAHGWLRRPELDTATYDAWEMPNGTLYAAEKGVVPTVYQQGSMTMLDITPMTVRRPDER
ncbi:conserved protein of unknown function (plasmid) [Rhodovastum atsumiense]|uniref:Uncharacterized protein n=1 Tax=Rhodovastum atsumiense TaxID=504468 RepID=A0A5M6IW64_9PROT|nr:hypothetical protein [Rhodovastum atsumiense]KAA5611645.1 hypothetical protein F1189_13880 [Rhodovastum atsumiense]CAH2606257.1 conserved protein of unknown function [Rhodovastum atsumiense]